MKNLLLFSLTAMLFVSAKTTAQTSSPLYGASPFADSLWTIDTTTFTSSASVLLVDTLTGTGSVTGVNGLAVHPCTGEYYLSYKVSGASGRLLGTVNTSNGIITQIGNTGDKIAGISFLDDTTLYAQTGDGASTAEELYTVDLTTAALTSVANSGNGNDGETICYNTDDGLFYHWSGLGTQNTFEILESFNPTTLVYTPITLSLHDPSEVYGSVYIGNNNFYINDANGSFYNVNVTTGVVDSTGLGNSPNGNGLKGLAFPSRYVWYDQANTDSICPAGDSTLLIATSGATAYQWYQDGVAITGATNDSLYASSPGSFKCEITRGTCVAFSDDSLSIGGFAVDAAILDAVSPSFCPGDSVTITDLATGGVSSEWISGGAVVDTDSSYTALTAGNLTYRLYSANGCFDEVAVVVTENALPTISGTVTDETVGGDGAIDATFTGAPVLTFDWDNDGTGDFDDTEDLTALVGGTYTVVVVDGNGCTETMQFTVGSVGLSEFGLNASMSIFPNPNNGEFTVSFSEINTENLTVQIVNTLGQVVSEGEVVNNSFEVDIREAGAGIYMIRITDGTNFATKQIIVE